MHKIREHPLVSCILTVSALQLLPYAITRLLFIGLQFDGVEAYWIFDRPEDLKVQALKCCFFSPLMLQVCGFVCAGIPEV